MSQTAIATQPETPPRPDPDSLALYVHWPFCVSKCPYCDFNSHVRETVDHQAWRDALLAELAHVAAETPGRRLTSIFFGGGTPSLMQPETVAAVIEAARRAWAADAELEVTLEANPGSVEAGRFRAYRAAGVGRVSLGIQALDDAALASLGRQHSVAEGLAALNVAKATFDRVSFDLIYARPGQGAADWQAELALALSFAPEHLSLYQLTIEPGTRFAALHSRGALVVPEEDAAATLYEITQARMQEAGRPAYEISNHAAPGAECRHNLTYWRYGDYAGIGPGAHGRLTLNGRKWATRTHRAPELWLQRVAAHGHAEHARSEIEPEARWREALLMGLRLSEGLPLSRLGAEAGLSWDRLIDGARLRRLEDAGLVASGNGRLVATAEGRQRLDAVLRYLAGQ